MPTNRRSGERFPSDNGRAPIRARSPHAIREQLSSLLRLAYTDERRNWHRGRGGEIANYRPGKQWDKTWPRMADFFLKHQVENYHGFIHVQFTVRGLLSICPSPQQCYGPAALRRWEKHKPDIRDIRLSLKLQMLRLEEEYRRYKNWMPHWSEYDVQTMVLYDHANTITALLRYCVAIQVGRADIAARYHDVSLSHYVFAQDAYNEVWGDLIPDVLRKEAQALCLPMRRQGF